MKLIEYATYIGGCREDGALIVGFNTPCCQRSMETEAPRATGEQWDSLTTCPYCAQMFLKIVTKTGAEGRIPQ